MSTTITCACIADAYVDKSYPSTNYGSAASLKINNYNYVNNGNRTNCSAFFKFNIPTIIKSKKIVSAVLKIYNNTNSNTTYITARTKDLTWDENTINYNNTAEQKNVQLITDASADAYANAWFNIPLTPSTVKQRIDSLISTGIEVYFNPDKGFAQEITVASRSTTGYEPKLEITYEDVPPDAPTLKDPVGGYKESTSIIHFEWQYNSSVGGNQKAFDFQWSKDKSTWNTVSQTTANNYYDMPANTLPSGNVYWKVRCYSESDLVSEYSSIAAFFSIGAPEVPTIGSIPTNTARPTVNWSSSQQQVCQIQVVKNETVVFDSGIVPGILVKSYKIKTFLEDGTYAVKIRIKNEYDVWSSWAEKAFTITTVKPGKPAFTISNSKDSLDINITAAQNAAYYLVYRSGSDEDNYICIGKTNILTYSEKTCASKKEYKYFVRAVTADEAYMDSDIKTGSISFKYSLIAPISNLDNTFILKYGLNKLPVRNAQRGLQAAITYFSGREYPITEFSGHIESLYSCEFALKTYEEVERFLEVYDSKETILYRDNKGRKFYGNLNNLSVQEERSAYTVSFTLTQIDYTEGVEV